jgi:hypothetical protein
MTPGVPSVLTPAAEVIIGTPKDDIIDGVGSGDVVLSLAGDDRIYLNDPTEFAYSHVYVDSGPHDDIVVSSGERDYANTFILGAGDDSASGIQNLDNTYIAGPGNDSVNDGGDGGARAIYMGPGDDRVSTHAFEGGPGIVDLGDGDDVLITKPAGEVVGGPGDDRVEVGGIGSGLDLQAGTGNDYLSFETDPAYGGTADMGAGHDRVDLVGVVIAYTFDLGSGDDVLTGSDLATGNFVDGGTSQDTATFSGPADPPNVCINVEVRSNCEELPQITDAVESLVKPVGSK